MRKLISAVLILAMSQSLQGGTAQKLDQWFDMQNFGNVTRPGVYEGQTARYATFGGVSSRYPVVYPFKFFDVQTPKFSAGCGGIDLYTGGFSAINADEFINNLRAIGQNAKSLAFMLALQVVSPQLSGAMENIQNWADKFKLAGMDSCEAATKLVGGAMEMFGQEQGNCIVKRMNENGEDWNQAKYKCTTGGARQSTIASNANVVDFVKGNLTWHVLMSDGLFSTDIEFAELIMNITGTVILKPASAASDAPQVLRIIEPAVKDTGVHDRFINIYNSLLNGSDSTDKLFLYTCTDRTSAKEACLSVSDSPVESTPNWTGMKKKIKNLLTSIVDKIYADTPLNAQEKGLISSTTIPLYRYLAASSAFFPKNSQVGIGYDFVDIIAEDILLRALQGVVSKVSLLASNQQTSTSKKLIDYRDDVRGVLKAIHRMQEDNQKRATNYVEMQQQIQLYERMMMSRLSSGLITSAMWRQ
ncbi:MAG: conjugal transfer protein TraH [Pseudobdellovibrionaceae bacterium]|nr:conjugal transfer protein TraH [Pseudobdellovibrionaceae bacterium]